MMHNLNEHHSTRENPSYYRKEPLAITEKMRRQIRGAFAEIDLEQIKVLKRLTLAQRVWQAGNMIDQANAVASYRLRRKRPYLSIEDADRIVQGGNYIQYMLKTANRNG